MTQNLSSSLLCKLASVAVHADEFLSGDSHPIDKFALLSVLGDSEVVDWVAEMTAAGMAPVKRAPDREP